MRIETSIQTTEIAQTATVRSIDLANGKSVIVTVTYYAKSATGKRISGLARAVFSAAAGTATILGAQQDPYQQKDSAGFPVDALMIEATGNDVLVKVKGYAGQGNTTWNFIIEDNIV